MNVAINSFVLSFGWRHFDLTLGSALDLAVERTLKDASGPRVWLQNNGPGSAHGRLGAIEWAAAWATRKVKKAA